MKKAIVIFVCATVLASFFASCGSTPAPDSKAAEPKIEDALEEGASTEELDPPEDSDTNAESAIDIAAENQAGLEKAESARQTAIDAGADTAFPEKFAEIDALYGEAKEKANAGEDASSDFDNIAKLYSALEQYSLAVKAKNQIDENNFADYDRTSYDNGCSSLSKSDELWQDASANADALLEAATDANGKFKNVIFEAYRAHAKEERTNAFIAKRNADTVRAGVASKEEYNAAVDEFRKGDSAYSMQNPESAYRHYVAAKEQFTAVYAIVSERRANAEKAMIDSQKQVDDAYSYAQNADKNAPLEGDDIEGIEASDVVLLESDTYENPESLEADIPEDIDAASEGAIEVEQESNEASQNKTEVTEEIETVEEASKTETAIVENAVPTNEAEESAESEETANDNASEETVETEDTETVEEKPETDESTETMEMIEDGVEREETLEEDTETVESTETMEMIEEAQEESVTDDNAESEEATEEFPAAEEPLEECEENGEGLGTTEECVEAPATEEGEAPQTETTVPLETKETTENSESMETSIETAEDEQSREDNSGLQENEESLNPITDVEDSPEESVEIIETEQSEETASTTENAPPTLEASEAVEKNTSSEEAIETLEKTEENTAIDDEASETYEAIVGEEPTESTETEAMEEIVEVESPVMEEE